MKRAFDWLCGWRLSLLLCLMSAALALLWAIQDRIDWLVPMTGAFGWGLAARLEWKQENKR